jgi:hypothetical protein
LSLDVEQITALIEQYEKETKAMRNEILKLCWYMRGALSYEEGMLLSFIDREIISTIIKENMETTQKSGLPFF